MNIYKQNPLDFFLIFTIYQNYILDTCLNKLIVWYECLKDGLAMSCDSFYVRQAIDSISQYEMFSGTSKTPLGTPHKSEEHRKVELAETEKKLIKDEKTQKGNVSIDPPVLPAKHVPDIGLTTCISGDGDDIIVSIPILEIEWAIWMKLDMKLH